MILGPNVKIVAHFLGPETRGNKDQFIVNRKVTERPFKHQALMSNCGLVVNDATRQINI